MASATMIHFMWQDDIIRVTWLLTHAWKQCTHQMALPRGGPGHLISPELAGNFYLAIFLL